MAQFWETWSDAARAAALAARRARAKGALRGQNAHAGLMAQNAQYAKGAYLHGQLSAEATQSIERKARAAARATAQGRDVPGAKAAVSINKRMQRMARVRKEAHAARKRLVTDFNWDWLAEGDGGNWIAGAIKRPGQLHRDLGVPQGKRIPLAAIHAAAKLKGKVGQRARLALTLRSFHREAEAALDAATIEQLVDVLGEDATLLEVWSDAARAAAIAARRAKAQGKDWRKTARYEYYTSGGHMGSKAVKRGYVKATVRPQAISVPRRGPSPFIEE